MTHLATTAAKAPAAGGPTGRRLAREAVFLALLCLFDLVTASTAIIHDTGTGPLRREAQIAAAVLGVGLLAWRWRAPVLVFALVWAHAGVVWFVLHEYRPTAALVVALYVVAVTCRPAVTAAALGAAVTRSVLSAVDSVRVEPYPEARVGEFLVTILMFAVVYTAACSVGTLVRRHRRRVRALQEERRRARQDAVAAERRRLAAELHDVVSHAVTLMVLQAAGAARLPDDDIDGVRQALLHIQTAGQQAMAELRRLLDVLQASGGTTPSMTPAPRLTSLESLIDTVRQAGLHVDLDTTGDAGPVDPSVELTAFRVTQEALTNALKHVGPGTRARVSLVWGDTLTVRVDNDGAAATGLSGLSAGHGLASLAERVRTVGGTLTTGYLPGGGFRVSAALPLAGRPLRVPAASLVTDP
ncbi:two-component sensor histidine kinase [Actinoplanes italicus]|uniref:histidine kinase n=1 Tax=Actinoplanes italicus TaxID=113567 RepID=A0A2T0KHI4_9ACTN|nr:signal transduction histidine kinase [Actinoplanes italicus]GIE28417.1 two-component sensor histidine kinase [Actinoplanes italicus]